MKIPTKKELKNFGLIWSIIFFIAAFIPVFKGLEMRIWALYVCLLFVATALFYPQIYHQTRFYQTWIKFGDILGKINSKIIIGILFYAIFMPIGLVLKILRKDLLSKKLDRSSASYFIDCKADNSDMRNQF
ncbi:MAG: SxtJ family membrane protein [Pseudomonadota bacterium]